MEIRFNENGSFEANDCRICYKNFSGNPSQFNRAGDKNFNLIVDEEYVDKLREFGYNVKEKQSDEGPWFVLPVKVKFNDYGPDCFIKNGRKMTKLDNDTIAMLDNIALENIQMDVRPYNYTMNGGGTSAYLSGLCVSQKITSRFAQMAAEYENENITDSNECPFE